MSAQWRTSVTDPLVSAVCSAFSSLWQKLSEIRAPALRVGTRLTQETGSVRNYHDLPRQMEVEGATQAHKDDRAEWLMRPNAGLCIYVLR